MNPKDKKAARRAAFERVVSEYEDPLLRYTIRLLRDTNAAQDVVQETFIRLLTAWTHEFEPSPQLSSWLYRVTHNQAVDHMRKESRRRGLHRRHAEREETSVPPDRGRAFRVSDAARQAVDALYTLGPRERQLVILKVFDEKTYREMSEITGLSVGNVGYILHHAMKKMAAELKAKQAL